MLSDFSSAREETPRLGFYYEAHKLPFPRQPRCRNHTCLVPSACLALQFLGARSPFSITQLSAAHFGSTSEILSSPGAAADKSARGVHGPGRAMPATFCAPRPARRQPLPPPVPRTCVYNHGKLKIGSSRPPAPPSCSRCCQRSPMSFAPDLRLHFSF